MAGMTDMQRRPPTPLWVKVFGIAALVLILAFIVVLLLGGEHGPGLHEPASGVYLGRIGLR
jgi:hypothetical protein